MNNTTRIIILLISFICGSFYQLFHTWIIYSKQQDQIKESIINNKELIKTINEWDTNINIWREINNINKIVAEKEKLNQTLSWTINILKDLEKTQDWYKSKIELLDTVIEKKQSEIETKTKKIELYNDLIDKKQKDFQKTTYITLNMDQYKKQLLFLLDWNKELRNKYYNQTIKLKQFYNITENNNNFINDLIYLCDRTEYSLKLKELKCIVKDEKKLKEKLDFFMKLNLN